MSTACRRNGHGSRGCRQLNSGGTATARYTQGLGIDEPLEVYEGNASYYYHADGLGSITELTKKNASTVNTYYYDTFGDDSPASSETVSNPFHFTARERDSETSLDYYRARYYDSLFGRFLSEDINRFAGTTNAYPYVDNNPPNMIDPYGLQHSPGGPEHPDPGVQFRCKWTDDCATLSAKIEIFKKVIADHIAWDAARGVTSHTDNDEIPKFQRGLNRCVLIHRIKCTKKGPPCEPVPSPVPSPKGFSLPSVPALPPPSPTTTVGVGGSLLLLLILVLSPAGI